MSLLHFFIGHYSLQFCYKIAFGRSISVMKVCPNNFYIAGQEKMMAWLVVTNNSLLVK